MADANGLFPAFDPTVPMGIRPVESTYGIESALGQASSLQDIQAKMLENQTRQLTLLARQKAGQIMNSAPDLQSGIDALLQDPLTSAFAPELAQTFQAIRASDVGVQRQLQEQATTGLGAVIRGAFPAITDPSTFLPTVEAWSSTLSPEARDRVNAAMPALKAALVDGLPDDPAQAGPIFQQRLASMALAAGIGPETVRASTGTMSPQVVTTVGPQGQPVSQVLGGPVTGNALGGATINVGPTTSESASMGAIGSTSGGIANDISMMAKALPSTVRSIDSMEKALTEFQAGGGAGVRENLARAAQAFKNIGVEGITDKLIDDVANGSLAATQTFNANLSLFLANQLKATLAGTGNIMRPEVDALMGQISASTDPNTLMDVLQKARYMVRVGYDMSEKWLEYKKTGEPLEDFPMWYATQMGDESTLPTKTKGGLSLVSVPREAIKGTKEQKASESGEARPPIGSFFK